jgi:hypothetical protein
LTFASGLDEVINNAMYWNFRDNFDWERLPDTSG